MEFIPETEIGSRDRAIVIGASVAGLLAARVLAEHFVEVVVLERDELPDRPAARKGTPQAVHPHGLLARGREAIESLFPGFTESLLQQGALAGDIGTDVAFDAGGLRFVRRPLGVVGLAASRLAIEAEIRRRVRAMAGVRLIDGVAVHSPLHDAAAGRVTGVRFAGCNPPGDPQTLSAALVVDCTGRGSRSPAWLRDWGYAAADEERVVVGLSYTSAYFRRHAAAPPPLACVIGAATPQLPRPSILIAQEPGEDGQARWVAGVGGYAGDHPEATLDGMHRRARDTGCAEIAALAERGDLLGPVMRYAFPHSQRRRYERLARFPAGYLVMGDALASFNPVYGQGMTVAACEALAMRHALAGGRRRLAARFFRAAAKVVDIPWQLAVGADLALPSVPGPRPLPVRMINRWVARVQRAAAHDPAVAAAFLRVLHLLDSPAALFGPRVALGAIRSGARRDPAAPSPALARPRTAD
jgi:2-polyprenyl-6-methoxyphenol hydroxylase-like FAD-dependent oxidoreductase